MNTEKNPTLACSIALIAQDGKEKELANFLKSGAKVVKQTEPDTYQWFATQSSPSHFRIIDFFANTEALNKHFAGKVAGALKEKASHLVEGGWEKGVLSNITKSQVIGSVIRDVSSQENLIGNTIALTSQTSKEEDLKVLLSSGANIVKETEPKTLLWYALELDKSDFVIFDIFADEEGRKEHFAGKVAGALKEKASHLVEGGWEKGVLKNVINLDILSGTF